MLVHAATCPKRSVEEVERVLRGEFESQLAEKNRMIAEKDEEIMKLTRERDDVTMKLSSAERLLAAQHDSSSGSSLVQQVLALQLDLDTTVTKLECLESILAARLGCISGKLVRDECGFLVGPGMMFTQNQDSYKLRMTIKPDRSHVLVSVQKSRLGTGGSQLSSFPKLTRSFHAKIAAVDDFTEDFGFSCMCDASCRLGKSWRSGQDEVPYREIADRKKDGFFFVCWR
jgi:hypothetical protein